MDLLIKGHYRLLLLLVVIVIGLLLLLLLFLLLLFLAGILFDLFFEIDINWDWVVLSEVSWDWDLKNGGVVLQVKQKLVQVNVERAWPWVEDDQVFLKLAYTANSGFKDFLNEDSLLRVYHLVVALLKLSVDVNVLNVETGKVLEDFVIHPSLDILNHH